MSDSELHKMLAELIYANYQIHFAIAAFSIEDSVKKQGAGKRCAYIATKG